MLLHSVTLRLVLLAVVFLVLPMALYRQFEAAEHEKRALLLRSLQVQGALMASALRPVLSGGGGLLQAARLVESLGEDEVRVKLLFRPKSMDGAVFYVASSRGNDAVFLEDERKRLLAGKVLPNLDRSCSAEWPRAVSFTSPDGSRELLTSLTAVTSADGCWVVITAHAVADKAGSFLGTAFAETPEVRLAVAFYLLMAALVVATTTSITLGLRRFARLARDGKGGFAAATRIPELLPVAEEFDRMVATLRSAAMAMRDAAVENAHALKSPLGAVVQSLEPLRPVAGEGRAAQALRTIELATERLSDLVATALRLDIAMADVMKAPRAPVNFSAIVRDAAHGFGALHYKRLNLATAIAGRIIVNAGEEMLEAIVEHILENAVDFTPPGGFLGIELRRNGAMAVLTIEDGGCGIGAADSDRIFERWYTTRAGDGDVGHQGIGLWVVRRNVTALGGRVWAEPGDQGGLRVVVELPLARQ